MTFRLRAARADDLEHLYEMAKLTGGGFTNLPPDRKALGAKLERASNAFANSCCATDVSALAAAPVMPRPTAAGVLGMARTTAFDGRRAVRSPIVLPARMDTTSVAGPT